jgi:hypothetical protein
MNPDAPSHRSTAQIPCQEALFRSSDNVIPEHSGRDNVHQIGEGGRASDQAGGCLNRQWGGEDSGDQWRYDRLSDPGACRRLAVDMSPGYSRPGSWVMRRPAAWRIRRTLERESDKPSRSASKTLS